MGTSRTKVDPNVKKGKKAATPRKWSAPQQAQIDAAADVFWMEKEFDAAVDEVLASGALVNDARTALVFAGAAELAVRGLAERMVSALNLAAMARRQAESVHLETKDARDTQTQRQRMALARLQNTVRRYRAIRDEGVRTSIPEHRAESPEDLRALLKRYERDDRKVEAIRKKAAAYAKEGGAR